MRSKRPSPKAQRWTGSHGQAQARNQLQSIFLILGKGNDLIRMSDMWETSRMNQMRRPVSRQGTWNPSSSSPASLRPPYFAPFNLKWSLKSRHLLNVDDYELPTATGKSLTVHWKLHKYCWTEGSLSKSRSYSSDLNIKIPKYKSQWWAEGWIIHRRAEVWFPEALLRG